jgi:hypothetical protein
MSTTVLPSGAGEHLPSGVSRHVPSSPQRQMVSGIGDHDGRR